MNSYKDLIDKLNKNTYELIKKYNIPAKENKIISELNLLLASCNKEYSSYHKTYIFNENALKEEYENYLSKAASLRDDYDKSINKITNASINQINEIKEKINSEQANKALKITRFKEEQANTTSSTNPLIYNHILNRNKILGEYELYKKSINKRYYNIVNTFLSKLENDNQQTTASNNKFMFRYNKANDDIINSLNKKLDEQKKLLALNEDELLLLKNEYEKKIMHIETLFNNKVINLNKNLTLSKNLNTNQYDLEHQGLIEEENENETNLNNDKSKIIKEFITNIEKNNTSIELLNKNTKRHINYFTKEYYFELFKINKILNSYYSNKKNYYEEIKVLNKKKIVLKRNLNKVLNYINSHHRKKLFELQRKKIILESIKNNELSKNKHLMEMAKTTANNNYSILKLNFDYSMEKITKESNFKIMELRNSYDNEKLDIMKEYKIKQSELFITKEKILLEIALIEDEIKYTNEIENQVCINNKNQLDLILEKNNINALLEIEKNKFLSTHNIKKLEQLSNKENVIFAHQESLAFINRDRRNALLDLNIKRSEIDYNHNKKSYSTEIDEAIINEDYNKKKQSLQHNDSISKLKAKNFYDCFNYRKILIINEFNFCKSVLFYIVNFLYFINKEFINISSENEMSFINSLYKNINNISREIIDCSKSNIIYILNDQINYETGSKYTSLLESTNVKFENDCKAINYKKNNLQVTIDNYNSALREFYRNIANKESELTNSIQEFKKGEIDKITYKKAIYSIKAEIKRYRKLIDKNEILIEEFKKELNSIPRIIASYNYELMKKKRKIQRTQEEESSILFKAEEDIAFFFDNLKKYFINLNYSKNKEEFIIYKEASFANSKQFIHDMSQIIKDYYSVIENLSQNVKKKNTKLNKTNQIYYNNNLKVITNDYNNRIFDLKKRIDIENDSYNNSVKDNNKKGNEIIEKYLRLTENKKSEYKEKCDNIDDNIASLYNLYYSRIISTSLNANYNLKNVNKKISDLNKKNANQNQSLTTYYINKKNALNDEFNTKNQALNNSFYYIPLECKKEHKKLRVEIHNEFLNYNKDKKISHNILEANIKNIKHNTIKTNNINHNNILRLNRIITKNRRLI
ncbi:MAG: hypothetical protein ACI35W_06150 [Anaeroplasmataceae bacterium]